MKKILYILSFAVVLSSCIQEVHEENDRLQAAVSGEPVEVSFNVSFAGVGPVTRLDADPSDDIENIYAIVFDENGYFTEYAEIQIGEAVTDHEGHSYENKVTVTLSQTDRKRAIHIIANCPVDQIEYGSELDIIAGMTVSGGKPAYWQRLEVDSIMDADEDGMLDGVADCIPLVRNFAEIKVVIEDNDYTANFEAESYYLYNDIDKGTVAPFNMTTGSFQTFLDGSGVQMGYDVLLNTYGYEGHAVSDITLNPAPVDETGFISLDQPWYMYERKISARTADEQSWLESPNHIIIKGTYAGETVYYKVDLVREITYTDDEGNQSEISQYFNILRNFKYTFTVDNVHSAGYSSLAEALANPAGNNLSGSVDTQGLVNLSDGEGRIFVSYTDTTLVSGEAIALKYKYVPNLTSPTVTANDVVHFQNIDGGDVIESYTNGTEDDSEGWRTLVIDPYDPATLTKQQTITLYHTNANLTREITFTLKLPYSMSVACSPNPVTAAVGSDFTVSVSIPDDLPEHMFPLDFNIESDNMSIAPVAPTYDANGSHIADQIPVYSGNSTIPGKNETTFWYLKTISWVDYYDLTSANGMKTFQMSFQTNMASTATKVYVTNKYFVADYDWICTTDACTSVEDVTITFSWQDTLEATQTIYVYDADGVEVADSFTATRGSNTISLVVCGITDTNQVLSFKFTAGSTTYLATATLQQVISGQTLNFNATS